MLPAAQEARVCLNGHLQFETPDISSKDCPKCRAKTIKACKCGFPLLVVSDYKPERYQEGLMGRDFCFSCGCLYPWAHSWPVRPSTEELTPYEMDLLNVMYPTPPATDFGLDWAEMSTLYARNWFERLFRTGVGIERAEHPSHSKWLTYQAAVAKHPHIVAQELITSRKTAYDLEMEALEKESGWRKLSGQQFERALANLLRRQKYSVEFTGGPGDQGADILLRTTAGTVVVQCKAYSGKVGPQPVRDLCGSMVHHKAAEGWLVAIDGFSDSAFEFAHRKPIKLLVIRSFLGDQI